MITVFTDVETIRQAENLNRSVSNDAGDVGCIPVMLLKFTEKTPLDPDFSNPLALGRVQMNDKIQHRGLIILSLSD